MTIGTLLWARYLLLAALVGLVAALGWATVTPRD